MVSREHTAVQTSRLKPLSFVKSTTPTAFSIFLESHLWLVGLFVPEEDIKLFPCNAILNLSMANSYSQSLYGCYVGWWLVVACRRNTFLTKSTHWSQNWNISIVWRAFDKVWQWYNKQRLKCKRYGKWSFSPGIWRLCFTKLSECDSCGWRTIIESQSQSYSRTSRWVAFDVVTRAAGPCLGLVTTLEHDKH